MRALTRAVALVVPLVAGCVSLSPQEERRLGADIDAQVRAQAPVVADAAVQRQLQALGAHLARVSDRPALAYRFAVLDLPQANAFALPGGYVYVTRGLVLQTRDVDELAAALAHEVAHVAARHGVERLERELRTGLVIQGLYQLLFGGEPDWLTHRALEIGAALWTARHSREDEREADRLALRYLARAGFDPHALARLLRRLAADGAEPGAVEAWFATHPLTRDRLAAIDATLASLPPRRPAPPPDAVASYATLRRRLANRAP